MSELLPCPFCGGEAEVYEMQYGENGKYSVFGVFCKEDSKAELIGLNRYQHGHFIDNFPTEAEAIEAWNTRAERTCKHERMFNLVKRECDGRRYSWREMDMPNYCPNCGAKVVSA